MRTILVTGFGPFPGAPYNPTGLLARRLAALRRPHLRVVAHVFETSYAAVDRELPKLLKAYRPDAILMFGLHGRAKTLRVETLARNVIGLARDVSGHLPVASEIVADAAHLPMRSPSRRLTQAARRAGVRAVPSRDAGKYLCNYLSWRATEAAARKGPRLAAFVHVPPVRRHALRKGRSGFTPAALERAGGAILSELAVCLGSGRNHP